MGGNLPSLLLVVTLRSGFLIMEASKLLHTLNNIYTYNILISRG